MGKLHVGSADDFYGFYDLICLPLQFFLAFFRDGEHRGGTEGITGMYAEGIDIFDEAYRDHVIICIADNFQFQFFPSKNRFFYQDLADHTGL